MYHTHVSSSSYDTHVSSSSYDTRVSSSSYDTHIYRTLQLSLPHLQIMAMSEALKKWFTLKPGGLNLGQKFTDLIHKDDIQRLVHLVTCPPPALSSGHRQDISLRLARYGHGTYIWTYMGHIYGHIWDIYGHIWDTPARTQAGHILEAGQVP